MSQQLLRKKLEKMTMQHLEGFMHHLHERKLMKKWTGIEAVMLKAAIMMKVTGAKMMAIGKTGGRRATSGGKALPMKRLTMNHGDLGRSRKKKKVLSLHNHQDIKKMQA